MDTCIEVLKSAYVTVLASTNGVDGANSTENVTNVLNSVVVTSQLFITTGIRITLKCYSWYAKANIDYDVFTDHRFDNVRYFL